MAEESETKSDKLLNQEEKEQKEDNKENIKVQDSPQMQPEANDDFEGYTTIAKYQLYILFFLIGIINHLGTILVMTGGRLLAYELEMKQYVTIYTSLATIFSVFTRIINSKLCIKVSYKKRVIIISFWMMIGYLSMFGVLTLHETILSEKNEICFILTFIPCFFLGSSYAFGEAAILAYLRLFPKTLIAGWSSGTGFSGLISGGLNLLSQLIDGLSLKFLYLILTPIGLLYLILFMWTFRILKSQERKIEKQRRLSSMSQITIAKDSSIRVSKLRDMKTQIESANNGKDKENESEEENNKEEENKVEDQPTTEQLQQQLYEDPNLPFLDEDKVDRKTIREAEDKEMEEMNKTNQSMSFSNFLRVMNMVGQVIVNLGLIYFLQFFCVNALAVRVCDRLYIDFLPVAYDDDGKAYIKGKFEFINMSYQVGMFTAKTLIKIVRKIQPIQVYTIAVATMNIIYIVEYYTGFFHWGYLLLFGFLLGIFSGGTYSGGFYTILHSDKVHKNYKELTVNVATLFNDSSTFLSGIAGYFALNFWMKNTDLFDNKTIPDQISTPEIS